MNKAKMASVANGEGIADQGTVNDIESISMLHFETLRILWELAAISKGPVLELGPYIGGSTIAMAKGAQNRDAKIFSVEAGGSYTAHPHLPSEDIIADLKSNLERFGVSGKVEIIQGVNGTPSLIRDVVDKLKQQPVGLIFIDADGAVERDFESFRANLRDGAFVVIDDYESDLAHEKEALIRPYVQRGIKEGFLEELGVFQWGTWVGRYHKLPRSMGSRLKAWLST